MNPAEEDQILKRVYKASRDECKLALLSIGVQPGGWPSDQEFQDQVGREYVFRRRRLAFLNEQKESAENSAGSGVDQQHPALATILRFVYSRIMGMSLVSIVTILSFRFVF